MNIIIDTAVSLDPSGPNGNKNLQLLLTALGIRSQIDFNGIAKVGKNWTIDVELERPEYWGNNLELMREDLDTLVLTVNKKPLQFQGQYKITKKEINITSDTPSEKAP